LCACAFDPSGSGLDGGAGNRDATIDATTVDAVVADASACPEPVSLRMAVNGVDVPQHGDGTCDATPMTGGPYVHVLLGDTVTLSAKGSCVQSGPIAYSWQISPPDATQATILPAADTRDITAYSVQRDRQYVATLTVTDSGGEARACSVFAFETHGWQLLPDGPGNADVRDIAFGAGYLWVAAKDGAYRTDPTSATPTYELVSDIFAEGSAPGSEMATVWVDEAGGVAGYVWFGHKDAKTGLWRADIDAHRIDLVQYDGLAALGAAAVVHDIGPAAPGVQLATNLGVTEAADSSTFAGRVAPLALEVYALARGADDLEVGGGFRLWNLVFPLVDINPYEGFGDNAIRALATIDGAGYAELWIASQGQGVARAQTPLLTTLDRYDLDDGLPSNAVYGVAVEQSGGFAGDVWIATDSGMGRFKRDRQVWIDMGSSHGLGMRTDLRAVVIDEATRTIYGGGRKGVVYIRVP
jgi:hypothetical protein